MKSDPSDILRAIRLSKATVRNMKQNLFWASFYNILATLVAAGIIYPNFGIIPRPEDFSAAHERVFDNRRDKCRSFEKVGKSLIAVRSSLLLFYQRISSLMVGTTRGVPFYTNSG
jgi:hypothetical protein